MNLNQQNGWIAVSDRLPNPDVPVLAGWLKGRHFEYRLYIYTCTYVDPDQDEGYCYEWVECSAIVWRAEKVGWWDTGDTGLITHWQPLPEPPVL